MKKKNTDLAPKRQTTFETFFFFFLKQKISSMWKLQSKRAERGVQVSGSFFFQRNARDLYYSWLQINRFKRQVVTPVRHPPDPHDVYGPKREK